MYVTEQVLLFAVGEPSAQVVLLKLPVPELAKVIVPVGADWPVAPEASVAVAVQLVPTPASTLLAAQLTVVVVFRLLTVTLNVPVLVPWPLPPPSPL